MINGGKWQWLSGLSVVQFRSTNVSRKFNMIMCIGLSQMSSYNTKSQLYTLDYRIKRETYKIGPTSRRMKENNRNKGMY